MAKRKPVAVKKMVVIDGQWYIGYYIDGSLDKAISRIEGIDAYEAHLKNLGYKIEK